MHKSQEPAGGLDWEAYGLGLLYALAILASVKLTAKAAHFVRRKLFEKP